MSLIENKANQKRNTIEITDELLEQLWKEYKQTLSGKVVDKLANIGDSTLGKDIAHSLKFQTFEDYVAYRVQQLERSI